MNKLSLVIALGVVTSIAVAQQPSITAIHGKTWRAGLDVHKQLKADLPFTVGVLVLKDSASWKSGDTFLGLSFGCRVASSGPWSLNLNTGWSGYFGDFALDKTGFGVTRPEWGIGGSVAFRF